jgi:hypothetical protein
MKPNGKRQQEWLALQLCQPSLILNDDPYRRFRDLLKGADAGVARKAIDTVFETLPEAERKALRRVRYELP